MVSCPLSRWERVRVRGFCPHAVGSLTPRPLLLGEGARGASRSCPKKLLDVALGCRGAGRSVGRSDNNAAVRGHSGSGSWGLEAHAGSRRQVVQLPSQVEAPIPVVTSTSCGEMNRGF